MTTDKKARKERPVARGVLDYFPDAIAEVANVSYVGNQQHNPGQEMFWDKSKSNDHADCIARHLMERGTIDDDGLRHSAKAAWRALAMLQVEIETKAPSHVSSAYSVHDYIRSTDAARQDVTPAQARETATAQKIIAEGEARRQSAASTDGQCYCTATEPAPGDLYTMNFAEEPVNPEYDQAWLMRAARQNRRETLHDSLDRLGCTPEVSLQIIGGTTVTAYSKQYVYIAGPMRGYDEFNFPAFDNARDEFLQNGWNVISPADIDRATGFSESVPDQPLDQRVFCYRDFYSLYLLAHLDGGAIAMLPGWEKSTGAVAEFFLARWLGLKVLDARSGQPLKDYVWFHLTRSIADFLEGQK